eukprot:3160691-Amphidinium_carterae.1
MRQREEGEEKEDKIQSHPKSLLATDRHLIGLKQTTSLFSSQCCIVAISVQIQFSQVHAPAVACLGFNVMDLHTGNDMTRWETGGEEALQDACAALLTWQHSVVYARSTYDHTSFETLQLGNPSSLPKLRSWAIKSAKRG